MVLLCGLCGWGSDPATEPVLETVESSPEIAPPQPERFHLLVRVIGGKNFPVDHNHFGANKKGSFCRLRFANQIVETRVAWESSTPQWNETFNFFFEGSLPVQQGVFIGVWSHANEAEEMVNTLVGSSLVPLEGCQNLETRVIQTSVQLSGLKDAESLNVVTGHDLVTITIQVTLKSLTPLGPGSVVRNEMGFEVPKNLVPVYDSYSKLSASKQKTWQDRWDAYLKKLRGPLDKRIGGELVELVRGGIPNCIRGEIWQVLLGSKAKMQSNEGYYQFLSVKGLSSIDEHHLKCIEADLGRTFPEHQFFQTDARVGQDSLRHLLVAYAVHNPSVGYVGSMSFLAAIFVLFLEEEAAFWAFTTLVEDVLPYFESKMAEGMEDQRRLQRILRQRLPILGKHLENVGIDLQMVSFTWFATMFINDSPTETACRIWDMTFLEGRSALFEVTLRMLKRIEPRILKSSSFGAIFKALKEAPAIVDFDELFQMDIGRMPLDIDVEGMADEPPPAESAPAQLEPAKPAGMNQSGLVGEEAAPTLNKPAKPEANGKPENGVSEKAQNGVKASNEPANKAENPKPPLSVDPALEGEPSLAPATPEAATQGLRAS